MSDAANPPTSPKKKSLMPSTPLRRTLRGLGHGLDPIVQVGHHGVTPAVAKQLLGALHDHELVKVKVGSECPQTRFEVAERLGDEPGVNVVQILGKTILLYKRHPQKPRYEGPAARARALGADAPPPKKKAARRGPRAAKPAARARSAGRREGSARRT